MVTIIYKFNPAPESITGKDGDVDLDLVEAAAKFAITSGSATVEEIYVD